MAHWAAAAIASVMLAACGRSAGPSPHQDAAAPTSATVSASASASATVSASAPVVTVLPPSPPSGPLLGAAARALCVAEGDVIRRWGARITKGGGEDPIAVKLPEPVMRLACGTSHVCAVTASGAVVCFGEGHHGALGTRARGCDVDPRACSGAPPAAVPGLPKMIDVAAAGDSTCAVSEAGEVYCWGFTAWVWMSEAGATATPEMPFRVPGLTGARRVALDDFFACALDARGGVWCWGRNEHGELGRGAISKRSAQAERVGAIRGASAITAEHGVACALAAGEVWCWGGGALGEKVEARCGSDEPCTPRPRRIGVNAGAPIVALSARGALDAEGSAYGVSESREGEAGCAECTPSPRKLLGLPSFTQIADAGFYACGLTAGREIVCWGVLAGLRVTATEKPTCAGCVGPLARIKL